MHQQNGDFTISPGDSSDFGDFSKSSDRSISMHLNKTFLLFS